MSDAVPDPGCVKVGDDAVGVDAEIVAQGLGLEPGAVLQIMRSGAITGICEQGIGEDAGRHRITFFYKGRRLRLIVEAPGRLVQRSVIDFGDRPLPGRLRGARAVRRT